MPRLIPVFAAAVLLMLVTACGGSPAPVASPTSAIQPTSTTTASATAEPEQAKPTHGLIVVSEDAGIVEIGMIDPSNGSYAVENRFNIGDFARGVNEPGFSSAVEFGMRVSPDRTRAMAQREVNGDSHTGWVTADGQFVDVTAATRGERNDFGGPINSSGVGFNNKGDFFYAVRNGDMTEVWSLPAGQTTGQTLVRSLDMLTTYRLGADGNFELAFDDTCDDFDAYSWMGDWYLKSDGSQIYRAARTPTVGTCGEDGQPLLPATNTAAVSDPVANPDLSEVAFVYENPDSTRSIYVVSPDGGSQPRKIENIEWPSESATLVGWV